MVTMQGKGSSLHNSGTATQRKAWSKHGETKAENTENKQDGYANCYDDE